MQGAGSAPASRRALMALEERSDSAMLPGFMGSAHKGDGLPAKGSDQPVVEAVDAPSPAAAAGEPLSM